MTWTIKLEQDKVQVDLHVLSVCQMIQPWQCWITDTRTETDNSILCTITSWLQTIILCSTESVQSYVVHYHTHTHTAIRLTTHVVLCNIAVVADNFHAKLSCAPPNQHKATLCTTKVYVGTEVHSDPWFAFTLWSTEILDYASVPLCTTWACSLWTHLIKVPSITLLLVPPNEDKVSILCMFHVNHQKMKNVGGEPYF